MGKYIFGGIVVFFVFFIVMFIFNSGYRARLICSLLEDIGVDLDKLIQYNYEVNGSTDCWAYRLKKSAYPHKY